MAWRDCTPTPIGERRLSTVADALQRLQVRFATLHISTIWSKMDPDIYSRGRRLMVWIGDRCDIPTFEDTILTPRLRYLVDEFKMSDYVAAVEYGEKLMFEIEKEVGYGSRNDGLYDLGLSQALSGKDYDPTYLPDIDQRSQQIRYPNGAFEYYQGYRTGQDCLVASAVNLKHTRAITLTRRTA